MPPSGSSDLTRRDVLVRTGGACLALAAGGLAAPAAAPGAGSGALLARHEATALALARALARDPRFAAAPAEAVARLRRYCATADAQSCARVAAQLDRLRHASGADLMAMSPAEVLDTLRAWAAAGDPAATVLDPRRLLAAAAVELACLRPEDDARDGPYALAAVSP